MEPIEVQMARFQEQMKTLIAGNNEARESRKEQYRATETIRQDIQNLSNRMDGLEKQFAKHSPTLEEFVRVKTQVQGAGILGKWLWLIGGFVLSAVVFLREKIIQMFGG